MILASLSFKEGTKANVEGQEQAQRTLVTKHSALQYIHPTYSNEGNAPLLKKEIPLL